MNVILMAAARGARVQLFSKGSVKWEPGTNMELMYEKPDFYRIHPDDEHLKYGPISTVLREAAVIPPKNMTDVFLSCVRIGVYHSDWLKYGNETNELHRSLFLLILSEALAEEGL